jgi:hypothetical protein
MRLRTAGRTMVVAMALSALAQAQQVDIRDNHGRLATAARLLNPTDVPPESALYGITVADSPEGKGVIVRATSGPSLLHVGDQVDEVQLPGIKDREGHVNPNPNYWPYQVWAVSDFYRLAAQCVDACLVRLRSIESLPTPGRIGDPRLFGYLPVGSGTGFGVELDEASGNIAKYVDLRTGERFSPPASVVFGR